MFISWHYPNVAPPRALRPASHLLLLLLLLAAAANTVRGRAQGGA